MNKKYYVDFGTGVGGKNADTLDEAMEIAVEGTTYTQLDVTIYKDGAEVARLPWWGVRPEEEDEVTVRFGDFGFYGEWIIL